MVKQNYLGNFRKIGILIFLVFSFFVGVDSAYALANVPANVCNGVAGSKRAIWAMGEDEHNFDADADPQNIVKWGCVEVSDGVDRISAEKMIEMGFMRANDHSDDTLLFSYDLTHNTEIRENLFFREQYDYEYFLIRGKEYQFAEQTPTGDRTVNIWRRHYYKKSFPDRAGIGRIYFIGFFGEPISVPGSVIWSFNNVQ